MDATATLKIGLETPEQNEVLTITKGSGFVKGKRHGRV
jgi:hypothetical protein